MEPAPRDRIRGRIGAREIRGFDHAGHTLHSRDPGGERIEHAISLHAGRGEATIVLQKEHPRVEREPLARRGDGAAQAIEIAIRRRDHRVEVHAIGGRADLGARPLRERRDTVIGGQYHDEVVLAHAIGQPFQEPTQIAVNAQDLVVNLARVRAIGVSHGIGGREADGENVGALAPETQRFDALEREQQGE